MHEIKDIESLPLLLSKKKMHVRFSIPGLSLSENREYETQANFLMNDCGCNTGRKFIFVGLPLMVLTVLFFYVQFHLPVLGLIVMFIFGVFIAGLTGKLIRLQKNRAKLIRLIKSVHSKL